MRPWKENRGAGSWRARLRHGAIAVALVAALSVAGAAAFVWSGIYDIAAVRQHTSAVVLLLTTTMDRSIARHADAVEVPDLSDPAIAAAGFSSYRQSCAQCHGAPGVAPQPEGLGMTPVPTNLAQSARMHDADEIYWATRNGLKMTGMPAWAFQYDEEELWQITAFVESLDRMSPADYRALEQASEDGQLDGAFWRELMGGDAR